MQQNDAHAATVRGYLIALLSMVWERDEGFNGKRPFGNSGWKYEVGQALFDAGFVSGKRDPKFGDDINIQEVERLVAKAIVYLGEIELSS